jgi:hypothetical protein
MEKRIYINNFERFIKESADDFKMIPSKRIWHSIYNDLHPSRKWPSVLMCLILFTGMLFIGYENTDPTSSLSSEKKTTQNNTILATLENKNTQEVTSINSSEQLINNKKNNNPTTLSTSVASSNKVSSPTYSREESNVNSKKASITSFYVVTTNPTQNSGAITNKLSVTKASIKQTDASITKIEASSENITIDEFITNELKNNNGVVTTTKNMFQSVVTKSPQNENKIRQQSKKDNLNLALQEASKQKNAKKKNWMKNASMEFYATPSIGYRTMSPGPQYDANPFLANTTIPTIGATNFDAANPMKHNAALNIETGFNIAYATSKRVKLKAGLQLNLTNYGITSNITSHPSPTTLATINPTTQAVEYSSVASYIANNTNAIDKIHNTTYQLSIPLGGYYKVLDKARFDLFVGGSVQPTYVFGGKPNVISSDRKYYVNESYLLRRFNMNTAAEAYINYKVGDLNFLAGPQFRYQLFSTYNKNIVVTEKLYNIGFKVGVSKSF